MELDTLYCFPVTIGEVWPSVTYRSQQENLSPLHCLSPALPPSVLFLPSNDNKYCHSKQQCTGMQPSSEEEVCSAERHAAYSF